jgi:uncharacterized protein (TIGR02246 family)
MARVVTGFVTGLVLLLTAAAAWAGERDGARHDARAVRKATASFVKAFNRGDAEAVAACWIEDGDFTTPTGQLVRGRQAIRSEFERVFSEQGRRKLTITTTSLRFPAPNVAVEDGTSRMEPVHEGPPAAAYHTIVHVRRDGRWKFASLRTALYFPPSNYEHLEDLEWIIGRWEYVGTEAEPGSVHTRCRWTPEKSYIIREFSAKLNNQIVDAATARIGWDPKTQRVKSWVFADDGGVFEGLWSRDGDRWTIKLAGTLNDGTPVSATYVMTRVDDQTMRFEATQRTRGGRPEPDLEPVELKRVR